MKKQELVIHKSPWRNKFEMLFFQQTQQGVSVSDSIVYKAHGDDDSIDHPVASFTEDEMQEVFNQLWQYGFRPKDGTGNSGHLEALRYHLEDMRKLVFEKGKK